MNFIHLWTLYIYEHYISTYLHRGIEGRWDWRRAKPHLKSNGSNKTRPAPSLSLSSRLRHKLNKDCKLWKWRESYLNTSKRTTAEIPTSVTFKLCSVQFRLKVSQQYVTCIESALLVCHMVDCKLWDVTLDCVWALLHCTVQNFICVHIGYIWPCKLQYAVWSTCRQNFPIRKKSV